MNETQFINKYKNSLFILKRIQSKDLSTYLVFVDSEEANPLNEEEEDIFWILLPETVTIYEDKDKEIIKLRT